MRPDREWVVMTCDCTRENVVALLVWAGKRTVFEVDITYRSNLQRMRQGNGY